MKVKTGIFAHLRPWRCVKPSSNSSLWCGQFFMGTGLLGFPVFLSKPCTGSGTCHALM